MCRSRQEESTLGEATREMSYILHRIHSAAQLHRVHQRMTDRSSAVQPRRRWRSRTHKWRIARRRPSPINYTL